MNIEDYKKSLLILKKIAKGGNAQREAHRSEVRFHLSRIIPEVEDWIRQRNFEPVQKCLAHLADLDRSLGFTELLGDYKYSYFVCINSAYVVQQ